MTGDESAPQASSARGTNRSSTKKPGPTAAARPGSTKGAAKKRAPRAATTHEPDVLERLSKLAVAEPADVVVAPMPIPPIVEADPSFPLPAPTPDQLAAATVAGPDAPSVPLARTDDATSAAAPWPPRYADLFPEHTGAVALVGPAPGPAPAPTEAMPATVIGDDVDGSFGVVLPDRPLQRPVAFQKGKPRVRRVTRVVRHVDPWSVFKVALVFNAILFLVCLTSGVLLWNVANATGTVDNVEKFFEQFGWSSFEFNGGELYHGLWVAGLFIALGLTGLAVFLATVFNLITDLVGGIRVSVLEEEVVARQPAPPRADSAG